VSKGTGNSQSLSALALERVNKGGGLRLLPAWERAADRMMPTITGENGAPTVGGETADRVFRNSPGPLATNVVGQAGRPAL
jgi:hypothetical protein